MAAFVISAVFGIVQMLLLSRLLKYATSGRTGKLMLMLLFKGLLYFAAAALLILRYSGELIYCLCGYFAGLPLGAVVYFIIIILSRRKGDDGF